MKRVGNTDSIAKKFVWTDDFGLVTKELGKSVGSEKVYANMDIVPPMKKSTKYHSHSQQEEFFFILSETGTLIVNEEEILVQSNDYFSKPAGLGIAHTFFNTGSEDLVILDFGTTEKEDTCYYPDEKIYLHKSADDTQQVFREDSLIEGWTSDPNEWSTGFT